MKQGKVSVKHGRARHAKDDMYGQAGQNRGTRRMPKAKQAPIQRDAQQGILHAAIKQAHGITLGALSHNLQEHVLFPL